MQRALCSRLMRTVMVHLTLVNYFGTAVKIEVSGKLVVGARGES